MKKGVVVKVNGKSAVVMSEDCSFQRIKAYQGMHEGAEIFYNMTDIINNWRFSFKKAYYAAGFLAIIFISYMIISLYSSNYTAYAYVSIDGKSSVQLVLNRKGRVIEAKSFDKKSEELLKAAKIKNTEAEQAVSYIVDGFTNKNRMEAENGSVILITTTVKDDNKKKSKEIAKKLASAAEEKSKALNAKNIVDIKTVKSQKVVDAKKNNMSLGRYLIYEKMKEKSKNVTIEEAKKINIEEAYKFVKHEGKKLKSREWDKESKVTNPPNIENKQNMKNKSFIEKNINDKYKAKSDKENAKINKKGK